MVKKIVYVPMGNPQPRDLEIGQWFNDQRTHQRVHAKWRGNRGHLSLDGDVDMICASMKVEEGVIAHLLRLANVVDIRSGSVLSPLIVKELLNRDAPVIVVAIGDNGSVIESNNTLKTLQTYENLAINVVKKPIVMAYYYNEGSASRKEVDKYVINMIESLRCLFANQHIGLDSQDLYHWLRYDKVTDYPNQLAVLTMVGNNDDLHKVYGKAISVATLAAEGESTDYPETVEYHTEGEISKELSSKIYSVTTHFVISDGLVDRVAKDIESHLAKLKEEKDSRVIRQSIIKGVNDADESGLIV